MSIKWIPLGFLVGEDGEGVTGSLGSEVGFTSEADPSIKELGVEIGWEVHDPRISEQHMSLFTREPVGDPKVREQHMSLFVADRPPAVLVNYNADETNANLYDAVTGGNNVTASNAIARWEDDSGNGHHVTQGTNNNQPVWDGSYPLFDGSNDSLISDIITDIGFNNGSDLPFSVAVKVRLDAWTAGPHHTFLSTRNENTQSTNYLSARWKYYLQYGKKLFLVIFDSNGNWITSGVEVKDSGLMQLNHWHTLVSVYDGGKSSSSFRNYIDGNFIPNTDDFIKGTYNETLNDYDPYLHLGYGSNSVMGGNMARAAIFDNALNSQEVIDLTNAWA